ncbi:hypothetical protein ABBQ38_014463 [Trebouxia sp. C0009 RCD-2024]
MLLASTPTGVCIRVQTTGGARVTGSYPFVRLKAPSRPLQAPRLLPSHVAVIRAAEGSGGVLTENEKEQTRKAQGAQLKDTARKEMDALVEQINQQSKTQGEKGAATDDKVGPLRIRLHRAIEVMQQGLVERDTEVRLLLLAALSQEHILYIGPPGTAKSELGRRLSRLCAGTFFERLLTRFSVPEELFGPLSMRALEDDRYVRQTEGYLPTANVAFVDEIFKANSAILNTLLTVLNERLFDNGTKRELVPLLCLVGASNELPESEELDALYDRFLIRRQVSQVSDFGLPAMLAAAADNSLAGTGLIGSSSNGNAPESQESIALTFDECRQIRQEALNTVKVPIEVRQLLADLRTHLREKLEPPVYVSDRRLVKAIGLMQVAAYTSGKDSVSLLDCLLLEHILWQQPDQQARITDFLLSQISEDDGLQSADYILASIFGRACAAIGGDKTSDSAVKRESVLQEATALRESLTDKLISLKSSQGTGIGGNMWISADESEAISATLLPKLKKTWRAHEDLLFEAITLQVAVGQQVDPVVLADTAPARWSHFVRNAPMDEVRPLATQQSSSFRAQANPFQNRPNLVSSNPAQYLADVDSHLETMRKRKGKTDV